MKDIYLAQKAVMRRIKKANAKKKALRKRKSMHTKPSNVKTQKREYKFNYFRNRTYRYDIIPQFNLLSNTKETIASINQILLLSKNRDCVSIYLNMSKVISLDVGALALLLSVINYLSRKSILIFGNPPLEEKAAAFFSNSGFLDHMTDLQGKHFERKANNPNMMFERGFDKTSNKKAGEAIRKAVFYLTGVNGPYQPVYSIMQEMCANSIEHANARKANKNWLLTVSYEKDKVIFTMTDIGVGILTTLKKKRSQQLIESIISVDNVTVLTKAFEKKYLSSTLDENRNKGLPKIKTINQNGYIEKLKVLTNDVLLCFDDNESSRTLSSKFKGTFYYWELTKKSIDIWKNRNL